MTTRKPVKQLKLTFATALITLFTLSPGALHAADMAPLTQIGSTPLPEVTGGDFDHFAVDLRHNRLYVAAEVYASIEVFDLKTGKHLLSARGVVKSPRKSSSSKIKTSFSSLTQAMHPASSSMQPVST